MPRRELMSVMLVLACCSALIIGCSGGATPTSAPSTPTSAAPTIVLPTPKPSTAPTTAPTIVPTQPVAAALPRDAVWVFVNERIVAVTPLAQSINLAETGKMVFPGPGQSSAAPDGSSLLYFRTTQSPAHQELVLLDTRTGKTSTLADGSAIWGAVLSPDGKSVACTTIYDQGSKTERWELAIRDLAGGPPRILQSGSSKPQENLAPLAPIAWSTKGILAKKIIPSTSAPPQGLYRIDPASTIYGKPFIDAVVSPDGSKAVLLQGQIEMGQTVPKLALNRLDIAGGQTKTIVSNAAIVQPSIRWSPDSGKLLYTVQSSSGTPSELRVVNADGSGARVLTLDTKSALRDAEWKDSKSILLLSADAQNVLHLSQASLDKFDARSLAELGRIPGSDPKKPGDQIIYIPR